MKTEKYWIVLLALAFVISPLALAGAPERADFEASLENAFICAWLGAQNCDDDDDDEDEEEEDGGEPPLARGDDPTGMWHLIVDFPEMPPFLEIMVFHQGGTLTESNTSLHGNSANPFSPFNGSEGHGIWQINEDGTTSFAFQKMVFDAEDNNAPVGFLRVKGTAILDDGVWQDVESNTSIVTPDGFVVMDFGQADVSGMKLSLDTIN